MYNSRTLKNRTRGKGKIKQSKRSRVENEELSKELLKMKESLFEKLEVKDKEINDIKKEIRAQEVEQTRLLNLKKPRKNKLQEIEINLKKLNKKLNFAIKKDCIGNASERLGELFYNLVENLATKNSFSNYSYLDKMKSNATFFLLKYAAKSYNPEKSKNAFAYCTQIAKNAFIQIINKENARYEAKKKFVEDYYNSLDYYEKSDKLFFD